MKINRWSANYLLLLFWGSKKTSSRPQQNSTQQGVKTTHVHQLLGITFPATRKVIQQLELVLRIRPCSSTMTSLNLTRCGKGFNWLTGSRIGTWTLVEHHLCNELPLICSGIHRAMTRKQRLTGLLLLMSKHNCLSLIEAALMVVFSQTVKYCLTTGSWRDIMGFSNPKCYSTVNSPTSRHATTLSIVLQW